MESFLRYRLEWPSIAQLLRHSWGWPLFETLHFFGICLLIGGIGIFDLRLLGMAKELPVSVMRRFLPWGIFGFLLAVVTGLGFVLGLRANLPLNAVDVLKTDPFLQLKLIFMALAGINLLAFYVTGVSRIVDRLKPGDDAPGLAKFMAGSSLVLWLAVIYFGRLIPWGL